MVDVEAIPDTEGLAMVEDAQPIVTDEEAMVDIGRYGVTILEVDVHSLEDEASEALTEELTGVDTKIGLS